MHYYMGIDIGGTKIAYGLFNEQKELVLKRISPSDQEANATTFFSKVVDMIREIMDEAQARGGVLQGVGIGITGFVDFEKGALSRTVSLPNLNFFPVVNYLKEQLDTSIPIVMDNDCHCGALAEHRLGAGRDHRNMLYCPISTGISTGIIIDGRLFRGSNGASGESGHMLAVAQGEDCIECSCGNAGCFNSLGSGKAITQHVKRWIEQGEASILPQLAGGTNLITAQHIDEAYKLGDPVALKAVAQMAHYLAMWVFNVYMLLNVDCIVFSGGLLKMGDKLLGRILKEFDMFHANGFPVHFYETELGSDSGLLGAIELLF